MTPSAQDKTILQDLARELAAIAALPVQKETAALWRRKNRLESCRPLVYVDEIPWHEMNVDDELTLRCTDERCHGVEQALRRTLYRWRHFPVDMVLRPEIVSPFVFHDTGFGIGWGEGARHSGQARGAAGYVSSINSLDDVARITVPQITPDWEATEARREFLSAIFEPLLPVVPRGLCHQWFAPWDALVTVYGIEKLYIDMFDQPALVEATVARYVDAAQQRLDQLAAHGLLSVGYNNHRVGSGGLGITDELPTPEQAPDRVEPVHQWGTSTGQIFSEVSPEMHEQFCLQYERPYLERFGLSCYGCCEPLHNKLGILRSVRNLRRISMSTWIDVDTAAQNVGTDYIFSFKPNPALLAGETWNPGLVREYLAGVLEKTEGCHVELILKDLHTLRGEPQRLWEWAEIAMELVGAPAGVCA